MINKEKHFRFGDNMTLAVAGLDIFTKNYCMNVEQTEKQKDLIFRCRECVFLEEESEACLIKRFAREHKSSGYDLSSFGAMT